MLQLPQRSRLPRRRPPRRRASCTIRPMTVPGRIDAACLLLSLDPPPWFIRHARAVAEVAGWLALRIATNGNSIDRGLVESAALLHDVDKVLSRDDPARAHPHGEGSAAWLTRMGHPELARAVAAHPVTRLVDGERYRRWSAFSSREERVVAYADKRAAQRIEPMAARFARWARRHPERAGWDRAVLARAERLQEEVCRAAGVRPADVRRLAWTGPALAAARQQMSGPSGRHRLTGGAPDER